MPPITVTGYVNLASSAMFISVIYTVAGSGGSSGGSGDSFVSIDQLDGCHNITGDARMDVGTAAFVLARSQALTPRDQRRFAAKYRPGSTFELPFPDGSVARFEVGVWNFTEPLVAEKPNSCQ